MTIEKQKKDIFVRKLIQNSVEWFFKVVYNCRKWDGSSQKV